MLRFRFLSGDVNWQEYGGTFVSKKLNNGDWDYWLLLDVINMHEATGDDTQPKYYVCVNAVAPNAVSKDEKESALQSCGWDGMDNYPLAMVECLNTYGIHATLWQGQGNSISKLLQDARKEAEKIEFLFGFYMDRSLNRIGNDGWDFISGNIGFK